MNTTPHNTQEHPESALTANRMITIAKIEPLQIKHVKIDGFEEFCEKYLSKDDKITYFRKIAQATNSNEVETIY